MSLTTFRRTGKAVSTPVWVARDGDALVVTTPAGSGKVKRLRNDQRVQLQPCSRRGKVAAGAGTIGAVAEVRADESTGARASALIRKKYGLEYRLVMLVERVMSRRSGAGRVILRLT